VDGVKKETYEAIVVGSGFGGAVAACRLAQAGVDVAVLERGRRYPLGTFPRHRRDLEDSASAAGWLLSSPLAWRQGGPYDVRLLSDVLVVQAAGYGGGSLIYANVQMRPPPEAFDDGWPAGYSRAALDPYYDLVAHMLDIRPVQPDPASGELPPKTRRMEEAAARLGRQDQCFRPNIAVRFEGAGAAPQPNRFGALQSGCVHCGECDVGCNFGAKNTLDLNYLALAERAGADVATEAEVTGLAASDGGYRVRFRDRARGGAERTLAAREVYLCLGAVNTTELLLRCRDQHRTLPHLSARLGHGYSANGDFLAFGVGTSPSVETSRGPTITTACVYDAPGDGRRIRFMVEDGGFRRQGTPLLLEPIRLARLAGRGLVGGRAQQARALRSVLAEEADSTAVLLAMGADSANGTIELARPRHRLRVRWDTAANLALYSAETAACRELVTALGGRLALAPNWRFLGQPSSVHNLGGCLMAARPEEGVVDGEGRVFGHPGLYVLDGAILPAIGVNPSHTIAAVAERCVEAAIRRRPGMERWRAPEADEAPRRPLPEDGVSIPSGGTTPPAAAAGGLWWREAMTGTCSVGPASVEVAIEIVDVASFLADPAHPGLVTGRVHVHGLTGAAGAPVEGGTFHLFLDEGDPRARAMAYILPFQASDGGRWVLHGRKDVRGRTIADFWRATTTLNVRLEPSDGGTPATGRLRIGMPAVARMLASLRPVAGRRSEGVAAISRFVRFFAATVLRLYVAGRRAGADHVS
jgi:cholesterol oxidase